jgi:hypothetical protein
MIDGQLIAGSLPTGFCIESAQQFYNEMFALGRAQLPIGLPDIVLGSGEPDVTERSKLWGRYRASTGAFDKWYKFVNGQWVSEHPLTPIGNDRRIWMGIASQLDAYDGGDSQMLNDAAGPMWEIDTAFAGRMPIGVGTLASSGTVIAKGDTGGSDQTQILRANLPDEQLDVAIPIIGHSDAGDIVGDENGTEPVSGSGTIVDESSDSFENRYNPVGLTEALGDGTKMTTISPYIGVYMIKRTSRKYYAAT